jgi:chemotaxis protein methyltransferase CheR
LVRARLLKRLRILSIESFQGYLDYVESDKTGEEVVALIDALTTNKTDFFREPLHFDFLRDRVLPEIAESDRSFRIWSAGCSSGEEPYTMAMLLRESIPNIDRRDVKILATDISTRVLKIAREGIYTADKLQGLPEDIIRKGFSTVPGAETKTYRVKEEMRRLVTFARLNLMERWPMKGPFDVIFCRNVMIYFDKTVQSELVQRYSQMLRPGGYLFVGHSESLSWSRDVKYVQPAVYQRG